MKLFFFLACTLLLSSIMTISATSKATSVLFNTLFNSQNQCKELLFENNVNAHYTPNALVVEASTSRVRFDHYYSLNQRTVRYQVCFSKDAIGEFTTDTRDVLFTIDVNNKQIALHTNPKITKDIPFLNGQDEYSVEMEIDYATVRCRITNLRTNQASTIEATTNGSGGCNKGALGPSFYAGAMHDYYCFGATQGSIEIKQMSIVAPFCNLTLLIYGDSITEPQSYYPSSMLSEAWTFLIMNRIKGKCMTSGRGGCQIKHVLRRIKNELPFLKSKYVMVTIGTNGGNTEENLSELIEYIISQGSTPILNNIPSNESSTQITTNQTIERIRQKYGIRGARFDISTSLSYDGKVVDKSKMFFENLIEQLGKDIYHHPNHEGSMSMYLQTLLDTPEIYD